MILFVYGTLLDDRVLAIRSGDPRLPHRTRPAWILGWRRVWSRDGRYPTLRRAPGVVVGKIVPLPAVSARHIAAYEGGEYGLRRVSARTGTSRLPVWTWIAAGGMKRPWQPPRPVAWTSQAMTVGLCRQRTGAADAGLCPPSVSPSVPPLSPPLSSPSAPHSVIPGLVVQTGDIADGCSETSRTVSLRV